MKLWRYVFLSGFVDLLKTSSLKYEDGTGLER